MFLLRTLIMPLNIYLDISNETETAHILDDYGKALKQLAAANIFPGDLLLKNFGVTRLNRVVFYDYDEIELVTLDVQVFLPLKMGKNS